MVWREMICSKIFNRENYFNHGNGYFITWCITFGVSFLGFA